MIKKNTFYQFFVCTIICLLVFSSYCVKIEADLEEPIATLKYVDYRNSITEPIASYLSEGLEDLNIELDIKVSEWIDFLDTLLISRDFDISPIAAKFAEIPLTGMIDFFSEYDNHFSTYSLNDEIPYVNESKGLLEQINETMDLEERKLLYHNWQSLVKDKIVPFVPLYAKDHYSIYWKNLNKFDFKWGIARSLPYMYFDSLHINQNSIEEINVCSTFSVFYNFLLEIDPFKRNHLLHELVFEKILPFSPEGIPVKTGLISDWIQDETNKNLFKFSIRDNIYWNPSFYYLNRTEESEELLDESDNVANESLLMKGFNGEYSNGTNQKVTAEDAVFTLLTFANPLVSEYAKDYSWIKDIWVDKDDPLSFWIIVDGDPSTEKLEGFGDFWLFMDIPILPNFFLNDSKTEVSYSLNGLSMVGFTSSTLDSEVWSNYFESPFSCGMYMPDYKINETTVVLSSSPFWNGKGLIDGTDQDLDFRNVIVHSGDEHEIQEAFLKGAIDILEEDKFENFKEYGETYDYFDLQSKMDNYLIFLTFNLARPFIGGANNTQFIAQEEFSNYTVASAIRKAIAHVIDREKIRNEQYNEDYNLYDNLLTPYYSYFNDPTVIKYDYNVTEAEMWINLALNKNVDSTEKTPYLLIASVLALGTLVYLPKKLRTSSMNR